MPIQYDANGNAITITGDAINMMRAIYIRQGLEIHLASNGKMRLTRAATPSNLLRMASEYTGVVYTNTRKGQSQAFIDMSAVCNRADPDIKIDGSHG